MLNKKYLPSLGFVILLVTIFCSALFIKWMLDPLNYETAAYEEKLGKNLAKEGKVSEALNHFLTAARITDNNVSTSRRYRYAGSASSHDVDKIKYYKLALKYNPNNQLAKNGLKTFLTEIRYIGRTPDGWSKGRKASAVINVKENKSKYELVYHTNNPKQESYTIKVVIDSKLFKEHKINKGEINTIKITLPLGQHQVNILIDETFNPKALKISEDDRLLGVKFKILNLGVIKRSKVSLNSILLKEKKGGVTFLSGGHLYGAPTRNRTVFPAPSVISNVGNFNKLNLDFFMGLGDIVKSSSKERIKVVDNSLIKKLSIPFLNSLGNHDISSEYKHYFNINRYYFSFKLGGNLFIVLDTETVVGEIVGKQLEFFKKEMDMASKNKDIRNIFIFSHKLIWAYGLKEKYSTVYNHVNAKTGYQEKTNFSSLIWPNLVSSSKKIFWISGDVGVDWTLPAFYDEFDDKIVFIAVGLGDTKDDMLLKTKINDSGVVTFELLSLVDYPKIIDIKKFSLKYWEDYFGEYANIKYGNRSPDGWSQGKKASVNINVVDNKSEYELMFYTRHPGQKGNTVKVIVNSKLFKEIVVKRVNKYTEKIVLPIGRHRIDISIDETFNPQKLGISTDDRDLGVRFEIKRVEPENG